ncbi:hypothetical protein NW762_002765 [Fusarium torreyae]|uniref:Uncharacterized protein n=1 Tax=Fusarium torreyae TaxID=1237075 RepID=A0A9W8VIW9_9HYPO|nr:hypothetical protein NW762_002765 [Fusarium torreyae]
MFGQAKSFVFAAANSTFEYAKANPGSAAAMGAGLAVVAAPAFVASPALAAAGFGANGIVGGSVAAGAQSVIGNVVAPGVFATLQSAGAGGYGVAVVHGIVQGAGVIATAAGLKSPPCECDDEAKSDEGDSSTDVDNIKKSG